MAERFKLRIYDQLTGWWFQRFFIFTPNPGEMIQFDEHVFQMGWFNHQLVDQMLFVENSVMLSLLFIPHANSLQTCPFSTVSFGFLQRCLEGFFWKGCWSKVFGRFFWYLVFLEGFQFQSFDRNMLKNELLHIVVETTSVWIVFLLGFWLSPKDTHLCWLPFLFAGTKTSQGLHW